MTQDGKNRSRGLAATLGALSMLMGIAFSGEASAQEACGDKTCPKGYSCETVPAPCPAIDCPPGSECQPCDASAEMCVPEPCTSDSDCDTDMVCLTENITECSGETAPATPACPPGAECDPPAPTPTPEPPECTVIESSQCVPRWALPCEADADCGAGFDCVAREECSCSGSGGGSSGSPTPTPGNPVPPAASGGSAGGASSGSGAAPMPAEPPPSDPDRPEGDADAAPARPLPPDDCSCRPSDTRYCQARVEACSADADCPDGWTCKDNPEGVCWADADGNSGCEPADPAKLCVPPYSDLGGGYPVRGENDSGAPGGPVATPSPEPGTPTTGAPVAPSPGLDPSSGDPEESGGDAPAADSRGGCAVAVGAGANGTSGAFFAAVAALAFALRRRLQRRPSA